MVAVVKKSLTLVYFPELIVKTFVSFAIQTVVIVCTLYALFKTFATGCMKFMRLFRPKLLLIYEPQTIMFSWSFVLGFSRLYLLNANRHSDHHLNPSKFYQCLHMYENNPLVTLESSYSLTQILLDPYGYCKTMNKLIESIGTEEERKRKEEVQEFDLFYPKLQSLIKGFMYAGIYFCYFYLF